MFKSSFGKFGPLIGIIYVGNTHCKFLIFSTKNAEILTFHEIKLRHIVHHAGWLEFDPVEIWNFSQRCIENLAVWKSQLRGRARKKKADLMLTGGGASSSRVLTPLEERALSTFGTAAVDGLTGIEALGIEAAYRNLVILEINAQDLVAVGICTQRGTTVMWDRKTGTPLYNAIGWNDYRSVSILKTLLTNVKGNINYLKHKSGLPLSTCFCALKIKWLLDTVPAVDKAIKSDCCLFGTMDSWILWNLTGGTESGVHSIDVTNAGYTLLMNVITLQWEPRLCNFFRIPMSILPCIQSNSEVYGFVIDGPLNGIPVACCIGEQPAALLGQLCTKVGCSVCTIDESCFILLNTGTEMVESDCGLLTSIAYKLGPKERVCYALEGAISNAGSSVTWLKKGLDISTEVIQNVNVAETLSSVLGENSMISPSCSSAILNAECGLALKRSEITFVPAFNGLYSPYWRYDARGIILGLTNQTTAENITQSAFEATGFQIREVIEAFKRDTPNWDRSNNKESLIVGGEFAEDNLFVQYVTDILGCLVERPQTTSAPCLGAMIATGISMDVVTLQNAEQMYAPPADAFVPATTPNRRELLYKRWDYAVQKCLSWNNYETYDADLELFAQREWDPNLAIRRSIPGSIFLTTTFILLLLAKVIHKT